MATWKTILDDDLGDSQEGSDIETAETAEAELHALRSDYHKGLSKIHESAAKGDADWETAKQCLAGLIEKIKGMPGIEKAYDMPDGAGEEDASMRQALKDRRHILYLSQKNLAHMLSQEPSPESKDEALALALTACAAMRELDIEDAGLVMRTALTAHSVRDDWTCRQLLRLVRGTMHSGAAMRLYKMLEDAIFVTAGHGATWKSPAADQAPRQPLPPSASSQAATACVARLARQLRRSQRNGPGAEVLELMWRCFRETNDGMAPSSLPTTTPGSSRPVSTPGSTSPARRKGSAPPVTHALSPLLGKRSRNAAELKENEESTASESPSTERRVTRRRKWQLSANSNVNITDSRDGGEMWLLFNSVLRGESSEATEQISSATLRGLLGDSAPEVPSPTAGPSQSQEFDLHRLQGLDIAMPEQAYTDMCECMLQGDCAGALRSFIEVMSRTLVRHLVEPSPGDVETLADATLATAHAFQLLAVGSNMLLGQELERLSMEARLFVGECCADVIRNSLGGRAVTSAGLMSTCEATLNALLVIWAGRSEALEEGEEEEVLQHGPERASLHKVRRLWLCATHWLLGAKRGDTTSALKMLRDSVRRWPQISMPHCATWGVIDERHVELLEVAAHDDISGQEWVRDFHPTEKWLEGALLELGDDHMMKVMLACSARRGVSVDSFLPLLCLKTCKSLHKRIEWKQIVLRMLQSAIPSLLSLLHQANEDGKKMQEWLGSVIDHIAEDVPADWYTIDEDTADKVVQRVAILTLHCFESALVPVFDALRHWLVRLSSVISGARVSTAMVLTVCLNEATSAPLMEPSLIASIAHFAGDAAASQAIRSYDMSSMEINSLGSAALGFFNIWGFQRPLVELCSASICMQCCLCLSESVQVQLDALQSFHTHCCDEDLWPVDSGMTLLALSRELQMVLEGKARDAFEQLQLQLLNLNQQTSIATMVGEMYWLLYSCPMCSFVYTDGRTNAALFNLSLETSEHILTLHTFYKFCIRLGLGNRNDRRATLQQLVDTTTIRSIICRIPATARIENFVFSPRGDSISRTNVHSLIESVREDVLDADVGPLLPVLGSIYYDLLAYAMDTPLPTRDSVNRLFSENLPINERKIVRAVDLCLRDLVFNPTRTETWMILHCRLDDYANIMFDEIGEACIPSALPESWHVSFLPHEASFETILDGSMRLSEEMGEVAYQFFIARNPSQRCAHSDCLLPDVRAAWGGLNLRPSDPFVRTVSMKNFLLQCMSRVVCIVNSKPLESPLDSAETRHLQDMQGEIQKSFSKEHVWTTLLVHALTNLTTSLEYEESSHGWRRSLATALKYFEMALEGAGGNLPTAFKVFSMCKVAQLNWGIFNRAKPALKTIADLQQVLAASAEHTSLSKALRLNSMCEVASIISNMTIAHLSGRTNAYRVDDLEEWELLDSIESFAQWVQPKYTFNRGDLDLPDSAMWTVLLNCAGMFRECRRVDPHHPQSVAGLASLLLELAKFPLIPDAVAAHFQNLGIAQISVQAAFDEMHKLFSKKLPQIIGIWIVEKASHWWESQLQRSYYFDYLRRTYARQYLRMAEACGQLQPVLDVLRDSLNVPPRKQTATLRWIVDRSTACLAKQLFLISSAPTPPKESVLSGVFDILMLVSKKVSDRTLYRLQRAFLQIFAVTKGLKSKPELSESLRACAVQFGGHSRSQSASFSKAFSMSKDGIPAASMQQLVNHVNDQASELVDVKI